MKRIFAAALTALCALLPVFALAQADITEDAVYLWQVERDESEQDAYLELMEAFDSPEWDGATVVSIDAGEDQGAASVERDGRYVLAVLQKDAGGWSVSQVNETLLDMSELPALYGVEPDEEGVPWRFQIRPDDDFSNMLWISCEGGMLSLYEINIQDIDTVQRLVPETRRMNLETAYILVYGKNGGTILEVYAQDMNGSVFCDTVAVDPAEFDVNKKGFSEILARAGAYVAQRNDPPFVVSDGSAYALPKPQLARFKKSGKYDVYTGPGTQYAREANGKASVSTNGWIQVFGEENGWLLVQYNVNGSQNRFGYIKATQQAAGVSVPALTWGSETAAYVDRPHLTNDPLRSFMEIDVIMPASNTYRRLGTLGGLDYIETVTSQGKRVRAFAQREELGL